MPVTIKMMPLAVAIAFAFAGAATAAEEQIVKISHVAPISGAIALLGKDMENAGKMAIE